MPGPTCFTVCWEDCPAEEIAAQVLGAYPDPRHMKQGARMLDEAPMGFDVFCHGLLSALVEGKLTKWQYWHSVFKEGDDLMEDAEQRLLDLPAHDALPYGPWLKGFPHTHGWSTGRTIIMGIRTPESGGELLIYPDGSEEPLVEWTPRPGVGIILPDKSLLHGVRPVQGDRERIVLICNAMEDE